ncbi:MAG: PIN domain-containing protein [Treponema sp.]|nr:PIN domain-containing protein [Treponema sp.]
MEKIDANVLLRYVLNDSTEFSPRSREIIDGRIVEIPIEVLCETVYVLTKYYKIDWQDVSSEMKKFFDQTQSIIYRREAILQGIEYFGASSLDFVDCVLAGYAGIDGDEIHTFDMKLQKLINKNTIDSHVPTHDKQA